VLGHHDEAQVVSVGGLDNVHEVSIAVTAQRRVNVNHAFMVSVGARRRVHDARSVDLVDCRAEIAQTNAPVDEGNLKDQKKRNRDERNLFPALQLFPVWFPLPLHLIENPF
jgi:hypothetical protein